MKHALALLFCALLLVTACAPQGASPNTDTTPTTSGSDTAADDVDQKSPEDYVTITPEDRVIFGTLPTDVQEVLAKTEDKAKGGFSYTYTALKNGKIQTDAAVSSRVYEKGTTRKLVLRESSTWTTPSEQVEEVVFVDGTATGYCTNLRHCENPPEARPVVDADYVFMGPLEWYDGIREPEYAGEATVENRKSLRLNTKVNGVPTIVYVDRYSGIPVQVEQGDYKFVFEKLGLGVTADQLKP